MARKTADPLREFDYSFPEELIAQAPASPRDSAKLLVYDRTSKKISWDVFANLPEYLPKGALLVLNETKVIPARLTLHKETGGRVRILFLGKEKRTVRALADRAIRPGDVLRHESGKKFLVLSRSGGEYALRPDFPIREMDGLLTRYGDVPIPPYIKHTPLQKQELKREYQTVFAKKRGSVAAPTASLHFTSPLLARLRRAGIESCRLTLHVNLGTFAPLTAEQLAKGRLHTEEFEISAETARRINRALKEKRPVVAAGTTVVRALEAAGKTGRVRAGKGKTDIFIRAPHKFRIVNGLITNFHVPRSSLLMLVGAFLSRGVLLRLYQLAIRRKFRLFSFGDAMFIK